VKLGQKPNKPLIAALAFVVLALVAGAFLLHVSRQHAAEAQRRWQQEEARLREVRERLSQVDEERRTIERYTPAYRELQARGIAGPERRVDWIDALRLSNQAMGGFGVEYRLSPQKPARLRLDTPALAVRESVMELRLRLLHEGDLIAFLRHLKAQEVGLFLPVACELKRLQGGPFNVRFEPKLAADCELVWLTLVEPGAGEEP
jgi:hypothetical protein